MMEFFAGRSLSWWLDVRVVLDQHDIGDANTLAERLTSRAMVTIPADITLNSAPNNYSLPKPTIGRIVHYIDKEGRELPAIIVAISSFTPYQWVYLRAFVWGDESKDVSDFAMYSEERKVRTWHWPEREQEN